MKAVGIILAGGLSSRFGSPKAFALLNGVPFYERAAKALAVHCEEIIVVTLPELVKDFPDTMTVIVDAKDYSGRGPLAGILSAMEFVEADRYVVMPCDMPYIDEKIIEKLISYHEKDIVAIESQGRFHPLVSVWDGSAKVVVNEALDAGQLRVIEVLKSCDVKWIAGSSLTDNEGLVFKNINTPQSLEGGWESGSDHR